MLRVSLLSLLLGCTLIQSSALPRNLPKARHRCRNALMPYRPADYDDRPVWGDGGSITPVPLIQRTTLPSPDTRSQLRISRSKCKQYCEFSTLVDATNRAVGHNALHQSNPSSNLSTGSGMFGRLSVEGGVDSKPNEFPHMVALGFGTPGGPMAWNSCGGTLISEWYVLTAAHCMDSDLGRPSMVRLGAHNVQQALSDKTTIEDVTVGDIVIHPGYQGSKGDQTLYNDIALIRLSRSVDFRAGVQPACLHDDGQIGVPAAVATGWGNLGFTDAPSDILQKVSLDIIPHQRCRDLIPSDPSIPQGIRDTQICAGILEGGHDTCSGDSGGPLQINNTIAFRQGFVCGMQVVGVTSFGKFCAEKNSPGVYTRVAPYVPWIENIVWGSGSRG